MTVALVLAMGAAATAVMLLVAPPLRPLGRPPGSRARWPVALVSLPVAALVATASPRLAALALIGGLVAAAVAGLWRRSQRRRTAERTADRVREICELLAAELAAGLPPGAALARAVSTWPAVAPVLRAFELGSDVPAAWRVLARERGAGQLRLVGAAWQVAHRTGHGLADAVARVAGEVRRDSATRRVVASELASARATARLLTGLPLVALAMGSGVGGSPWAFLLGHPWGLACLAAGLALGLGGLSWIEALADLPVAEDGSQR